MNYGDGAVAASQTVHGTATVLSGRGRGSSSSGLSNWLTVLFPPSRAAAAAALEADLKPFPMRYYCAYDAVFDGPTQLNSDPLLAFV